MNEEIIAHYPGKDITWNHRKEGDNEVWERSTTKPEIEATIHCDNGSYLMMVKFDTFSVVPGWHYELGQAMAAADALVNYISCFWEEPEVDNE